jgi:hypothetical protein
VTDNKFNKLEALERGLESRMVEEYAFDKVKT